MSRSSLTFLFLSLVSVFYSFGSCGQTISVFGGKTINSGDTPKFMENIGVNAFWILSERFFVKGGIEYHRRKSICDGTECNESRLVTAFRPTLSAGYAFVKESNWTLHAGPEFGYVFEQRQVTFPGSPFKEINGARYVTYGIVAQLGYQKVMIKNLGISLFFSAFRSKTIDSADDFRILSAFEQNERHFSGTVGLGLTYSFKRISVAN